MEKSKINNKNARTDALKQETKDLTEFKKAKDFKEPDGQPGAKRQLSYKEQEDLDSQLLQAADKRDSKKVKELINSGANIEASLPRGRTVLLWAVMSVLGDPKDRIEIVKILIANKANVNANSELDGTALMCTALVGETEIAKLLLDNGAYVNDRNDEGETALIIAAKEGHLIIVDMLIERGANVNARSYCGDTALQLADENGHTEIAYILKKYGATE
jgi:ankyrin repeat protein